MTARPAISAIILAAGLSQRFGGDKLSADLAGQSVIARTAANVSRQLRQLGITDIRLVTAPGFRCPDLPGVSAVTAAGHAQGQAHSMRAGLLALPPECDAAFVFLGDMPFPASTALLQTMIAQIAEFSSVRPKYNGAPGHPVLIHRCLWPAILAVDGDHGARDVLCGMDSLAIDSDESGVVFDIDTPADLDAARRRFTAPE